MTVRFNKLSGAALVTGLALGAVFGASTALMSSSETMLRTSFSAALQGSVPAAAQRMAKTVPLAGSEDFWLSAIRQDGGAPVTKTVALGDRISLTLGGEQRDLEVAAVSEFQPKLTEIDTNSAPSRFVLVTAKDARNASATSIRFVMEIQPAAAAIVASKPAQAL